MPAIQRIAKNGTILEVRITATALIAESKQMDAIETTKRAVPTLSEATQ